jgi:hypothetical protein
MDDQLDAAGACPATYTKNTTTRNGELPFMMMPLYLIPYSRNSRAQLDYDPNKGNFKKAFDNFDYKNIALFRESKDSSYWTPESFVTN